MALADSLTIRVHELEAENERLRCRIADLEKLTNSESAPVPGLSIQQSAIFKLLKDNDSVSRERLIATMRQAIRRHRVCRGATSDNTLKVQVYYINRKMRPHGWRVRSIHGYGYKLIRQSAV